jgi:hypothetical protein
MKKALFLLFCIVVTFLISGVDSAMASGAAMCTMETVKGELTDFVESEDVSSEVAPENTLWVYIDKEGRALLLKLPDWDGLEFLAEDEYVIAEGGSEAQNGAIARNLEFSFTPEFREALLGSIFEERVFDISAFENKKVKITLLPRGGIQSIPAEELPFRPLPRLASDDYLPELPWLQSRGNSACLLKLTW